MLVCVVCASLAPCSLLSMSLLALARQAWTMACWMAVGVCYTHDLHAYVSLRGPGGQAHVTPPQPSSRRPGTNPSSPIPP